MLDITKHNVPYIIRNTWHTTFVVRVRCYEYCISMEQVYTRREKEISVADADEILHNVDNACISTRPAQRPVGGNMYVYKYSNATTKGWMQPKVLNSSNN